MLVPCSYGIQNIALNSTPKMEIIGVWADFASMVVPNRKLMMGGTEVNLNHLGAPHKNLHMIWRTWTGAGKSISDRGDSTSKGAEAGQR